MARITAPTLLAAVSLGFAAPPISADVAPADVWDSLKAQMSIYGEVTASETTSGGNLSVSDISMTTDIDEFKSTTKLTGSIVFRDLGNGTVAVDFPTNMSATLAASDGGSEPVAVTIDFSQQGMTMVASGDPGEMSNTFSAASMNYRLSDMTVDGHKLTANLDVGLSNTAGTWLSEGTDTRRMRADYTVESMNLKGLFSEQGKPEKIAFDATVSALEVVSDSSIPEGFSNLNPEEMFSTGFAGSGDMKFGPVTYAVQVTAEGQTTQIDGKMTDGSFGAGMDGDRVRYSTVSNNVDMSGAISGMPFPPVDVHYDTSKFDFLMPIGQTDTPEDFGLSVALKGFTVSDFLWAMIDPAQQLPRDPADVVLDLSGQANWLVNIFDPTALEGSATPGKLDSLTLNALEVTVAGASLTGTGGFTFDNDDLKTFNGMPRPTGAIDLAMSGGITLLDKLTAMQLVPQEQAMGIKMMSGMFTKPGPSPDTLTTKIEIDPTGGVFANGQRLQ